MKKNNKVLKYLLFCITLTASMLIFAAGYNNIGLKYKEYKFSQTNNVASSKTNTIKLNKEDSSKVISINSLKKEVDNKITQETANYEALTKFVLDVVRAGYVEEVKEKDLYENAINGILSSLDPHSAYLNAEAFKEMQVQTKGEFAGLGIEITKEFSLIKIISPIEGTPAEKAGIMAGDYISHINGKSVMEMNLNDAVTIMRGKTGEKVIITILRKGESKPIDFSIKREIISIKAARGHRENDIIYVKVNSFTEKAYQDTLQFITNLEKEIGENKVQGLILDLRNNPGGLLDQSIKISELFLDYDKTIVSIKGKNDMVLEEYKSKNKKPYLKDKPIVVLVNEGSASASEIVSGALQDHKRAIILGTKTFGKGSVQNIMPVPMGGAIKMTIARYYTPSGTSIQAKGIEPDIIVQQGKLEFLDYNSKFNITENDLKGHLENNQNKPDDILTKNIKENLKKENHELYKQDFQLARAIDLILGINIINSNN